MKQERKNKRRRRKRRSRRSVFLPLFKRSMVFCLRRVSLKVAARARGIITLILVYLFLYQLLLLGDSHARERASPSKGDFSML